MAFRRAGFMLALLLCASGCAPAPQPKASPAAPRSQPVKVVEGSIVFTDCPDSGHLGARRAEAAINKLVDGCTSVPGGSASFVATLEPGGAIEIAAPGGSKDEGVVPICVLKSKLRHHLWVRHRCSMEVRIEERRTAQ